MPPVSTRTAPFVVLDDFLQPELHAGLLAHALDSEADFAATTVQAGIGPVANAEIRRSSHSLAGLGPFKRAFRTALEARCEEIRQALGIAPFDPVMRELDLVVHRDGGYYRPHVDTMHGGARASSANDRLLTMVYYFHRQPRGHSGGEIALYPFVPGSAPERIEAADNRLVAFPAMTVHEVCTVEVPGDAWADARFSVNCWFSRVRPE